MISKQAIQLFKSLNIPKYDGDGNRIFNPVEDIPGRQFGDWNILNSARSRGKTTNILLLGMCCNAIDGTQIQYIRQYDDMLTPSKAQDLFDVIIGGGYITKVTGGRFNNVKYFRRRWYYVLLNEKGEVVEQSPDAFCVCLGINKEHDLRSTYNAPKGDFIVFDEYMRADKMYMRDEFVIFNNLLSTIIRDRTTASIFLLGNLTDITSPYLLEMGLLDTVRKMNPGDFKHYDVDGTIINVFYIPTVNKTDRSKASTISKYFRAWANSKMVGITGGKGNWALKIYPRAPRDSFSIVDKAQIECDDGYICRELRLYPNGYFVMFYPLHQPLEDKVTYTRNTESAFSPMRRFGMGYSETDEVICTLINRKRCYYSDNVTGERVESYLKGNK